MKQEDNWSNWSIAKRVFREECKRFFTKKNLIEAFIVWPAIAIGTIASMILYAKLPESVQTSLFLGTILLFAIFIVRTIRTLHRIKTKPDPPQNVP